MNKLGNGLVATMGFVGESIFPMMALAGEINQPPADKPGLTIGSSTGAAPPPGIYLDHITFFASANYIDINGNRATNSPRSTIPAQVSSAAVADAFVVAPGWQIFGANYFAIAIQPVRSTGYNVQTAAPPGYPVAFEGFHNTFLSPLNLSWMVAPSLFLSTGFGVWVPDGTQTGTLVNPINGSLTPTSAANVGAPWWTFVPSVAISYLGNDWNLTARLAFDVNTRNSDDQYLSGTEMILDLTATKRIGKWEIGPVGYYDRQITPDSDPLCVYCFTSGNRPPGFGAFQHDDFAIGGLVGYDFGGARLRVYATDVIYERVWGSPADTVPFGWTITAKLGFRIWAPDESGLEPKSAAAYK